VKAVVITKSDANKKDKGVNSPATPATLPIKT
jgi:hypothetical protein